MDYDYLLLLLLFLGGKRRVLHVSTCDVVLYYRVATGYILRVLVVRLYYMLASRYDITSSGGDNVFNNIICYVSSVLCTYGPIIYTRI